MDCPNCGAYNTASNFRCRRCNHILPTDGETTEETAGETSDWGPASEPGRDRWEDHFHQPSSRQQDPDAEAETVSTEASSSDPWTQPAEEPTQPSDWDIARSSSSSGSSRSSSTSSPNPWASDSGSTGSTYTGGSPPNYLWPSIGATLCCCAPLGIPAIVYASRVDAFVASGDLSAAQEASNKAKMWCLAAAGVAVLIWIAIFCTGAFGAEGTTV
jgi:hypothetical protein